MSKNGINNPVWIIKYISMEHKYTKDNKRLTIYGSDSERDIQTVRKLIDEDQIPKDIETIVYQRNRTSVVVMMIRGIYLENVLNKPVAQENATPAVVRPGIKTILKQINETNARQSVFAGLVIYSMPTRRFLLLTPRNRNNHVFLLGDNPIRPDETPIEIVCRCAHDDMEFENGERLDIDPSWPVELKTLEIGGTAYHTYLLVVRNEFKPTLSDKFVNSIWAHPEAFPELRLHQSVTEVFTKDHKLLHLINPVEENFDYSKLIDRILHTPMNDNEET